MIKPELWSTVYAVLQEALADQILDSLGDHTWIGMNEERTEFLYGAANRPRKEEKKGRQSG